tara:strand:- start:8621 stop:12496 length:3876 start_codon:yes stop_codon:yes gene_type:complete
MAKEYIAFVKKYAKDKGISYKNALSQSKKEWKEHKGKNQSDLIKQLEPKNLKKEAKKVGLTISISDPKKMNDNERRRAIRIYKKHKKVLDKALLNNENDDETFQSYIKIAVKLRGNSKTNQYAKDIKKFEKIYKKNELVDDDKILAKSKLKQLKDYERLAERDSAFQKQIQILKDKARALTKRKLLLKRLGRTDAEIKSILSGEKALEDASREVVIASLVNKYGISQKVAEGVANVKGKKIINFQTFTSSYAKENKIPFARARDLVKNNKLYDAYKFAIADPNYSAKKDDIIRSGLGDGTLGLDLDKLQNYGYKGQDVSLKSEFLKRNGELNQKGRTLLNMIFKKFDKINTAPQLRAVIKGISTGNTLKEKVQKMVALGDKAINSNQLIRLKEILTSIDERLDELEGKTVIGTGAIKTSNVGTLIAKGKSKKEKVRNGLVEIAKNNNIEEELITPLLDRDKVEMDAIESGVPSGSILREYSKVMENLKTKKLSVNGEEKTWISWLNKTQQTFYNKYIKRWKASQTSSQSGSDDDDDDDDDKGGKPKPKTKPKVAPKPKVKPKVAPKPKAKPKAAPKVAPPKANKQKEEIDKAYNDYLSDGTLRRRYAIMYPSSQNQVDGVKIALQELEANGVISEADSRATQIEIQQNFDKPLAAAPKGETEKQKQARLKKEEALANKQAKKAEDDLKKRAAALAKPIKGVNQDQLLKGIMKNNLVKGVSDFSHKGIHYYLSADKKKYTTTQPSALSKGYNSLLGRIKGLSKTPQPNKAIADAKFKDREVQELYERFKARDIGSLNSALMSRPQQRVLLQEKIKQEGNELNKANKDFRNLILSFMKLKEEDVIENIDYNTNKFLVKDIEVEGDIVKDSGVKNPYQSSSSSSINSGDGKSTGAAKNSTKTTDDDIHNHYNIDPSEFDDIQDKHLADNDLLNYEEFVRKYQKEKGRAVPPPIQRKGGGFGGALTNMKNINEDVEDFNNDYNVVSVQNEISNNTDLIKYKDQFDKRYEEAMSNVKDKMNNVKTNERYYHLKEQKRKLRKLRNKVEPVIIQNILKQTKSTNKNNAHLSDEAIEYKSQNGQLEGAGFGNFYNGMKKFVREKEEQYEKYHPKEGGAFSDNHMRRVNNIRITNDYQNHINHHKLVNMEGGAFGQDLIKLKNRMKDAYLGQVKKRVFEPLKKKLIEKAVPPHLRKYVGGGFNQSMMAAGRTMSGRHRSTSNDLNFGGSLTDYGDSSNTMPSMSGITSQRKPKKSRVKAIQNDYNFSNNTNTQIRPPIQNNSFMKKVKASNRERRPLNYL